MSSVISIEVKGLQALKERIKKEIPKGTIKVGVLEGATSLHVASSVNLPSSPLMVYAPVQEFGGQIPVTDKMRGYLGAVFGIHLKKNTKVINIPPRPFLRTTYKNNKRKWFHHLCKALIAGRNPQDALELVAIEAKADVVDQIRSNMPPPNSSATMKIKEKFAPGALGTLQFTGTLLHSIDYEILE